MPLPEGNVVMQATERKDRTEFFDGCVRTGRRRRSGAEKVKDWRLWKTDAGSVRELLVALRAQGNCGAFQLGGATLILLRHPSQHCGDLLIIRREGLLEADARQFHQVHFGGHGSPPPYVRSSTRLHDAMRCVSKV